MLMSHKDQKKGFFVISLDFELMWGMFDKVTEETYGDAIRGGRQAIPKLLRLFAEHKIHATWATVGMVSAYSPADLEALTPLESDRPHYLNPDYSSYIHIRGYKPQIDEMPELYFAPELIEQIVAAPGQELASHTFSHCFPMEALDEEHPSSPDYFAHDCLSAQKAFERFKIKPTSLVFPRNQVTAECLKVLRRFSYTAYRGTENSFLYRPRMEAKQKSLKLRLLRFLDRYFNITGHHTYNLYKINRDDTSLINIPASRLLAPVSRKLFFLEPLRRRRLKRAMTKAAKRGHTYHLWWHPHNFGRNQDKNLAFLKDILKHYHKLQQKYDWQSANMSEVATHVIATRQ